MTGLLSTPLRWKTATGDALVMLQGLQGNILKGHGRNFTANLFFTFKTAEQIKSRRALRDLANFHIVSAYRQLLDADDFKRSGKKRKGGKGAGPFVHLALSAKGYDVIGETDSKPDDVEFRNGMRHADSIRDLGDPDPSVWENDFRSDIHGIVIAAHETQADTGVLAAQIREVIEDAGGTVFVQHGAGLFNAAGEGIEHFGYVDGRSQPLMLVEDVEAERAITGTDRWNPEFPLGTALVEEKHTKGGPRTYGSYFVFRKLEQRVRDFKTREQQVATALGFKDEMRELAGAMIVGRFEDGTPVTISDKPRGLKPPNDFDYSGDAGIRCPFHAHIRKVNPRGSSGLKPAIKDAEEAERQAIMPRRGIPYEDARREVHPAELPDVKTMEDFTEKVRPRLPKNGVGLLFMAYNSNIQRQFKTTQSQWANNADFPISGTFAKPGPSRGIDPVIGQGILTPGDQKLPNAWDDPAAKIHADVDFSGFVHMKGGEYFFSPSLTFLLNL